MKLIAHRGNRIDFPENTLPAIESAADYQVDGVEFDLELTADNYPVVLHQETLENNQGRLQPAGLDLTRQWLNKMDYSEVTKIDAGSWFDSRFSGLKIPSFSDVLSLNLDLELFIELKDPYYWKGRNSDYETGLIEKTLGLIKTYCPKSYQVCSFNPFLLTKLRKKLANVKIGLNIWYDLGASLEDALSLHKEIDLEYLAFHDRFLIKNPEIIKNLSRETFDLASFPVSEYEKSGKLEVPADHLENIICLSKQGVEYFFIDDLSLSKKLHV